MTKQERSWILYDWANSAFTLIIVTAIFPLFFKSYAASGLKENVATAYLGYANTISSLIIALLAPIMGTIADYKDNKKRFLVFFFLLGIAATLLLSTSIKGAWLYSLIIFVFGTIGYASANIFYDSLLVDVTKNNRMDWISTSGFAWGYIGSTIPFVIAIAMITYLPKLLGEEYGIISIRAAFIITALWWGIFAIPLIRNVKQIHFIPNSPTPIKDSFARLGKTFLEIKKYRNIFIFLIAYFLYIDGVVTIIKMAVPYAMDIKIGLSGIELMLIILVIQIVAFPFALLYGVLSKKISSKILLVIAILIYIFIAIFAFFIETKIHFWILAMLVASAQGGVQALSRSYFGQIVPKERAGEFFGFYNIMGKFAAIVGPFIVGSIAYVSNIRYGMLGIIPLFVIGLVLLIVSFKK